MKPSIVILFAAFFTFFSCKKKENSPGIISKPLIDSPNTASVMQLPAEVHCPYTITYTGDLINSFSDYNYGLKGPDTQKQFKFYVTYLNDKQLVFIAERCIGLAGGWYYIRDSSDIFTVNNQGVYSGAITFLLNAPVNLAQAWAAPRAYQFYLKREFVGY